MSGKLFSRHKGSFIVKEAVQISAPLFFFWKAKGFRKYTRNETKTCMGCCERGCIIMLLFLLGLMIGGIVGIITMCLVQISRDEREDEDE